MLTLRMLAHLLPGVYKDLYPILRRKLRLCDRMMAARAQMSQCARELSYTADEAIAAAQAGYIHLLVSMPISKAVAYAAAAYDHVDCVKYCLSMGTYSKTFKIAIQNGSVGVVKYMIQNGQKVDHRDLENALVNERLDVASLLYDVNEFKKYRYDHIARMVCWYGKIASYDFMLAHGHLTTEWDLQHAGAYSLEMFKYVYALVVANGIVIERQIEFPLIYGRIDILDYVHTHVRKYTTMHVHKAATVESLEWCRRMNIWEITHDQHDAPAAYGDLDACKWLIANGVPFPNSRDIWKLILSYRELSPYVIWMIENNKPPADITEIAADYLNIEVLEYLRTHGYPLRKSLYTAASDGYGYRENIRLFKYLMKHVPCDSIHSYAIFSGVPELFKWTLDNHPPCDIDKCLEKIKFNQSEGVLANDIWLEMAAILEQYRMQQ